MVATGQMLKVLDPTAEVAPVKALVAPRPIAIEGKRLGLLANGKRNSVELLEAVLDLLAERYQFSSVVRLNKGNASRPAPAEIIDRLARECDLAITATGD